MNCAIQIMHLGVILRTHGLNYAVVHTREVTAIFELRSVHTIIQIAHFSIPEREKIRGSCLRYPANQTCTLGARVSCNFCTYAAHEYTDRLKWLAFVT